MEKTSNYIEDNFNVKIECTNGINSYGKGLYYFEYNGIKLWLSVFYNTKYHTKSLFEIFEYKNLETIKKKVQEMIDNVCNLNI